MIYFKKEYKLMIHSVNFDDEDIRATYHSEQCAESTMLSSSAFSINMNNHVLNVTTIDKTSKSQEVGDFEVELNLSNFAQGIRNELATVSFSMNREKILTPSCSFSVNFYTQSLTNRKGSILYKFIDLKTTQIPQAQVQNYNGQKQKTMEEQQKLTENAELSRMYELIEGKDKVINSLQKKIISLIDQTRKLNSSLERERSLEKLKLKEGMHFNLNINSDNHHLKRVNEKLQQQNDYFQKRLKQLQIEIDNLEKQNYETKIHNNKMQIEITHMQADQSSGTGLYHRKKDGIREMNYEEALGNKSKMTDSMYINQAGLQHGQGSQAARKRKSKYGSYGGSSALHLQSPMQLNPNSGKTSRSRSATMGVSKLAFALGMGAATFKQSEQERQLFEDIKSFSDPAFANDPNRFPKMQAALKNCQRIIERQNDQKSMLDQKLRIRDEQVEHTNKQLQKSKKSLKVYEKQFRQKSSNIKGQFDERMATIRMETEMKITEMRKTNKYTDYDVVIQQEKRQIELQKMRYECESLREKYEQALQDIDQFQKEKYEELERLRSAEQQVQQQKQLYKSKYYEIQDSLTKQQEQLSINKDKADKYDNLVGRLAELQQIKTQNMTKIEDLERQRNELVKKSKRYEDKLREMEPKWEYYHKMQEEFDRTKRRNENLIKLNERFEQRMDELKKFALRLESAYYDKRSSSSGSRSSFVARNQKQHSLSQVTLPDGPTQQHLQQLFKQSQINSPKNSQNSYNINLNNSNIHQQQQSDQQHRKQLQQKMQSLISRLRIYQREYYQEQMRELSQSKKSLIEVYYAQLVEEQQRIQKDERIRPQDKAQKKREYEQEISREKEERLMQLQKKLKYYEQMSVKIINEESHMPRGLSEQVAYLDQKMRKFEAGEMVSNMVASLASGSGKNSWIGVKSSQAAEMKGTIERLSGVIKQQDSELSQLKARASGISNGGVVAAGGNVNNMSNFFGQNTSNQNLKVSTMLDVSFTNQRKSMIDEMQKNREVFAKSFEDVKRANTELLRAKSALEIELQSVRFKEQKLLLKHQERQRELERIAKKTNDEFTRRIQELERKLQKKNDENVKNKLQKEEFRQSMQNLIGELNTTAGLLEKREQENIDMEGQIQQLSERIAQYQQAQRELLEQVANIKEQAAFNESQFKILLEERNEQFLKIERVKNNEIQKLGRFIEELEKKLEEQVSEVLIARNEVEKLTKELAQTECKLQETTVSCTISKETLKACETDNLLKINTLEDNNNELQRNLLDIAEQMLSLQMELNQYKIKNQSLAEQLKTISQLNVEIKKVQQQAGLQKARLTQIIEQQTIKLKKVQDGYQTFSNKIDAVEQDNISLKERCKQWETRYDEIRERLDVKHEEVNELKSKLAEMQIVQKRLQDELKQALQEGVKHQEAAAKFEHKVKEFEAAVQAAGSSGNMQLPASFQHLTTKQSLSGGDGAGSSLEVSRSMRLKGPTSSAKLKPPPSTYNMKNSSTSVRSGIGQDGNSHLGMSMRMSKSNSRTNDLGASGVVKRKNLKNSSVILPNAGNSQLNEQQQGSQLNQQSEISRVSFGNNYSSAQKSAQFNHLSAPSSASNIKFGKKMSLGENPNTKINVDIQSFKIQDDCSIRGTQIDNKLKAMEQQDVGVDVNDSQGIRASKGSQNQLPSLRVMPKKLSAPGEQIRPRMWTVRENEDEMQGSTSGGQKKNSARKVSCVQIDLNDDDSYQDKNLDSEMSRHDESTIANKHLGASNNNDANPDESMVIDGNGDQQNRNNNYNANWKQTESQSQDMSSADYMQENAELKLRLQQVFEQRERLIEEVLALRERLGEKSEQYEHDKRGELMSINANGLYLKRTAKSNYENEGNFNQNEANGQEKIQTALLTTALRQPKLMQTLDDIENEEILSVRSPQSPQTSSRQQNLPLSALQQSTSVRRSRMKSETVADGRPRIPTAKSSVTNHLKSSIRNSHSPSRKTSRRQSLEASSHYRRQGQSGKQNLAGNSKLISQLQLELQQLQAQNDEMKIALNQEQANNQKLIEELQLIVQSEEKAILQIQVRQKEIERINTHWVELQKQMQSRIEKLVCEQIDRETKEVQLYKDMNAMKQEIEMLQLKCDQMGNKLKRKQEQIIKAQKITENHKDQFRKYEQQAELEILSLKERLQEYESVVKEKSSEVQLIAEDYFVLKSDYEKTQGNLAQLQVKLSEKERKVSEVKSKFDELGQQSMQLENARKAMNTRNRELQCQLVQKDEQMSQMNQKTALLVKKYEIRLQANQKEIQGLRQKCADRDSTIQTLKHEIGLYNQQTQQVKSQSQQLSLQLQRTQRKLKEIMQSYQNEFDGVAYGLKESEKALEKYKNVIYQKDDEIGKLTKTIRKLQEEVRQANESEREVKNVFQKYKQSKIRQNSEVFSDLQIKIDEYEKLKTLHQKESEQFFTKETEYLAKIQKSAQAAKGYKEKLLKYQSVLAELEKQMARMSQRPTQEQYDELEFETELFRNRIQQLQGMLREKQKSISSSLTNSRLGAHGPDDRRNQHSNNTELRRYKIQKQRELQDISNQIQKYASKVSELQESNYYLKRELEKAGSEIAQVLQDKQKLDDENFDLKEDLEELKEQIEFYKGKRIQGLSKLLNETM